MQAKSKVHRSYANERRVSFICLMLTSCCLSNAQIPMMGPIASGVKGKIEGLVQKYIDKEVAKALGQALPLNLNANDVFPTVPNSQLLGGRFKGVTMLAVNLPLHQPLPSGDISVPTVAFCSEYSVHRPGHGVIHKLGPLEGRLAKPIGQFLTRATAAGKDPREVQSVSWAIQAGVPYSRMPELYQKDIDAFIPEYKEALMGSWTDRIGAKYSDGVELYRKAARFIPRAPQAPDLNTVLQRLGEPGKLMLEALKQQAIIMARYEDEAHREAALFSQQGAEEAGTAVEDGPWTVIVPGRMYVRLVVAGGNLQSNNLLQIRVLPGPDNANTKASPERSSLLVPASYGFAASDGQQNVLPKNTNPSLSDAISGPSNPSGVMIAYSQGQATQALALALPSGQHPCGDPEIPAAYNTQRNWHEYEGESEICSTRDTPSCTRELVYEALKSNARAIAPAAIDHAEQTPSYCGTLELLTTPILRDAGFENRVKTIFDDADYQVINYTLPGHIFYPGQINRQIIQKDGKIYIHTLGYGNGSYRCLNVVGGTAAIWPTSDQILCQTVSERLNEQNGSKVGVKNLYCLSHLVTKTILGASDGTIDSMAEKCLAYTIENLFQ